MRNKLCYDLTVPPRSLKIHQINDFPTFFIPK
nr:MAG TPA: hypothetical protein [Caudoviricetes sp.]